MHFSSYNLGEENANFFHNIQFEACDLDKWIYTYFAYSFKLRRLFIHTHIQRKEPVTKLIENIVHSHSTYYQIFVG